MNMFEHWDADVGQLCDAYRLLDNDDLLIYPQSIDLSFLESGSVVRMFVQELVSPDLLDELSEVFSDWQSAWELPGVRGFISLAANKPIEGAVPSLANILNCLADEFLSSGMRHWSQTNPKYEGWLLDDDRSGCYRLKQSAVTENEGQVTCTSVALSDLLMIKECQHHMRECISLIVSSLELYTERVSGPGLVLVKNRTLDQRYVQLFFRQFKANLKAAQKAFDVALKMGTECKEFTWMEKATSQIKNELAVDWLELEKVKGRINAVKVMMLGESLVRRTRIETFKNYVALATLNGLKNPLGFLDPDFLLGVFRTQFVGELKKEAGDRDYMAMVWGVAAWKADPKKPLNEKTFQHHDCWKTSWAKLAGANQTKRALASLGEAAKAEMIKSVLLGHAAEKMGDVKDVIELLSKKSIKRIEARLTEDRACVDDRYSDQLKLVLKGDPTAMGLIHEAGRKALSIASSATANSLGKGGRTSKTQ